MDDRRLKAIDDALRRDNGGRVALRELAVEFCAAAPENLDLLRKAAAEARADGLDDRDVRNLLGYAGASNALGQYANNLRIEGIRRIVLPAKPPPWPCGSAFFIGGDGDIIQISECPRTVRRRPDTQPVS